jgi:hypothetical protein
MLDMKDQPKSPPDLHGSAIDPSDPEALEAEIARDRAEIAASVAALKGHLSTDALLLRGAIAARSQIAGAARAVGGTARDNPIAAGLIVAGVAWLILGRKGKTEPEPPLAGSKFDALTRWEDEGGPPSPETEPDPDPEDDWLEEARSLRDRAAEALKKLEAAAKQVPAAETLRARSAVMAAYSADLATALRRGLGGLSAAAQDRIVAARDAAFRAGDSTGTAARGAIREHPLLSGLITALFGASLAAWLPLGAREKQLLGPTADGLIDEARRLYEAERDRATELAADLASGLQEDLIHATTRLTDTAETLAHPPA